MLHLTIGQEQDLESLIRRAGEILISYWPGGKERRALKVGRKSDGSIVTSADFASNDLLERELRILFPDQGIISEETGETPTRRGGYWVIDPLDGTAVFERGDDYFRILISYVEEGRVEAGIAYFPVHDVYYFSCKGKGMWKNRELLRVSTSEVLNPAKIHSDQTIEGITPSPNKLCKDGGSALLAVCEGKLDGAIFHHNEIKVWDIAPFVSMIEESGGMGYPSTVDLWAPRTGLFWGANQFVGRLIGGLKG